MSLVSRAAVAERDVELDLEVGDGETLAVVGPNGAGKSTALSLISGDLRPSSGSVSLDGRILADDRTWVPPHDRRVTTLSQDSVLFPHLSALGNVMFPPRAQGVPRREARRRAEVHLEQMGLADLAARRPAQLSGGQAQKVAIARALAADPRSLLAGRADGGAGCRRRARGARAACAGSSPSARRSSSPTTCSTRSRSPIASWCSSRAGRSTRGRRPRSSPGRARPSRRGWRG
ncbi:ATP-binding cassette domain-containing protein [Brachybacterium sp. GPGPB12]|uniref:ATP-binding cassette domain-containing protein n=1 Tax=Brachybacterium sp. GPGPB12 TaxID=3023517 RepID=UPI0031344298